MKTKRTVFIYNTKETTEQEAKYIVDILNCDDSMLWDEADHDGVEVFEVPVESNANQETFEEFLEREGYDEGRTQEIWEDGARKGAEWQEKRMYSKDEVLNLLIEMNSWPTIFDGEEDITEWFEQLKTK
jgi:hypothetical protein